MAAPGVDSFNPALASEIRKLRRRRVGVLCGGWSAERAISLKSGAAVLGALKRLNIPAVSIDVTPRVSFQISRARIDLAFLAVHGPFGEDGTLQGVLDVLKVPYTGSGVRASAVAMHKPTAKVLFKAQGLPTSDWFCLRGRDEAGNVQRLFRARGQSGKKKWSLPVVVKPASQGSALGTSVVSRPSQWPAAVRAAFALEDEILVERFVPGTEITVAVLDGRALPVVEIVPKNDFYDFNSKYAPGGSRHIVPARLPARALARARLLAEAAHSSLGCRHFSRIDMIVNPSGSPVILEANTLPGMTDVSLFPDAARAAGISFDQLILKMLALAARESSSGF